MIHCFGTVVTSVGAYWTLRREHAEVARISLRTGVVTGFIASVLVAFRPAMPRVDWLPRTSL